MKPNIIFYFSDQQRWDTCGCYGQKLEVTPNLDELAKNGTLFENAFTCQPVCGPARACLQSGQYATKTGCFKNGIALPQDIKTLASYFNDDGYETAYVGKWHLATDDAKTDYKTTAIPKELRGDYQDYWMASDVLEFTSHGYNGYVFDKNNEKHEFIGYRADCINNYAIDYIRNKESDKPFFMFISQIEPHHQNDRGIYEGPDGSKEKFANFEVPGDLEGTVGNFMQNYPDYLGQCNSLDYNVGKLIDTLKDKGIFDNTIIIYTSDHGSHFCTRNKEYKRSCHESSIHIPMIAYGGKFTGGNKIKELVSLIDLPATLLDCAEIDVPKHFDGNSLLALVDSSEENWKKEVFLQISESQVGRCIRTDRFKYSVRATDKDGVKDASSDVYYEDFLYDLQNDPHERINLIEHKDYAKTREELKAILQRNIKEIESMDVQILPMQA